MPWLVNAGELILDSPELVLRVKDIDIVIPNQKSVFWLYSRAFAERRKIPDY